MELKLQTARLSKIRLRISVMDNAVLSIDNLKEDVKVILTDEQGRQVSLSTMKAGEREINLNTNSLSNGIYFVRIVGETIQRTEKIIKK